MINWFMITPLFVTAVTRNSVKTECEIIVICLVSYAAHEVGNLKYKVPKFFPVVFHNLSGYESHLFIKTLEIAKEIFLAYHVMRKTTFLSRNR